jgi:transposase InsO family protein
MRAMYGRDEIDPPRQEPPRHDPPSMGSSSRGSSCQPTPSIGWQHRPGQSVPVFPGSRIVPTRRIDSQQTTYQRMLKFGTSKVPKLSRVETIIDAFSRWVKPFPTKSTTAAEIASMILNHVGRFGSPEIIHTDQGPAFHNELVTELVRLCGIE